MLTPSNLSGLALQLFGVPQVTRDGEPVEGFRSTKARALLFYIAAATQPQSRIKLAALLWGELPEDNANANLRKTLTNLRKVAGAHLAITRQTVVVDEDNPPWLDVRAFEAALDSGDADSLSAAIDLYRGDFLDGFYVDDAPEFESWMLAERHRLRERLLLALKGLAELEAGQGRLHSAIDHAQRLLSLEPLREDGHRLLMRLLAQNGQRARALAQYQACAAILAEELGVEPGEKTTALVHQIQDGAFETRATTPRHNLPAPVTSFVGRRQTLARIERWLADGPQRLLTISGPGGVGKTRLAQQAAWKAADDFAGGVWLVSLTALQDVSELPTHVATTLGLSFVGQGSPRAQLVRYLRRKSLLLILDNAEHLVSQALSDLLTEILTQAPDVRIMVTSRQRLQMQAEQVIALSGLAYAQEETAAAADYPAGQLFLQRAQSHGQRLPDTPPVARAVQRLCRLVDGLPLALELAASWTPVMSLPQILAAVRRDLDALATELRDVPARHRSMRAVFETSWGMLVDEERRIMRQLSYFRGGFSAQHAAEVVSATSAQLRGLEGNSLIRRQQEAGERYEMHELIRQYAGEKLAQRAQEARATARAHGQAFATFLAAREEAILGANYLQAKAQIDAEVENVRKAWDWVVASASVEAVAGSAETLHYYFLNTQGLFAEAAERFERAAVQLEQHFEREQEPLVAGLLLRAAVNRRMLGQLEDAARLADESLTIFYRHELGEGIARAGSTLGLIRMQQNEKGEALRLAQAAVEQARELDAPIDLCLCLNNLAFVRAEMGDREAAAALAAESVALARDIGYPHGELSALNMLGVYYHWLGESEKAQRIFEQLVARCREAATRSRLAQAVNNLGALYKEQEQPAKALPLLQEAANLYEDVGQEHYAAFVGVMLGQLALERGDEVEARRHCLQALQVARNVEMPALALDAMTLFALMLRAQGRDEEAVTMLTLVTSHEATLGQTREAAEQDLQSLRVTLAASSFDAAQKRGAALTLEDGMRAVYDEYAVE